MTKIELTPYDLAQRFIGVKEIAGQASNPQIIAMLRLDESWPQADEVSWCSGFVNYIMWLLRQPRTKSLRARSWLQIGMPVIGVSATPGFDVVILKQKESDPGPEVSEAPWHVGFFAGGPNASIGRIMVLGGNQANSVNVTSFSVDLLLGIRRVMA
jgi:uncharacterized protein (TIGR02594 family)